MTQRQSPAISLTLGEPRNLNDVKKWAAVAAAIGVPATSTVSFGVGERLTVTADLAQIPFPESDA